MSTENLWSAVRIQAAAWAVTPVFVEFARQLPRNASQRSEGIPGLLQRVQAGVSVVGESPLRLATNLQLALTVMPEEQRELQKHLQWFDTAQRVEGAHRLTIAWLRSRLPGYPNLPAPQLTLGTPLTTNEFTYRLIWAPGERGQGLQFREPPPEIALAIYDDEQQKGSVVTSSRAVAAALLRTSEWVRLARANDALDSEARQVLHKTRKRLRERLSPDRIDAFEPKLALGRDRYRDIAVAEELELLSGPAAEYVEAFDAADRLLETAASDVFGQLASYPLSSLPCGDLEIQPGDPTVVVFTVDDVGPAMPELGMLSWLEDPLVPDAVQIVGSRFHWDGTGNATMNLTARLLRQTSIAWPRQPESFSEGAGE